MSAPELTETELAGIGRALLGTVAACDVVGHASPAGTLDYLHGIESVDDKSLEIVRDFIAWTANRKRTVPGCEERLRWFVRHLGLSHRTDIPRTILRDFEELDEDRQQQLLDEAARLRAEQAED